MFFSLFSIFDPSEETNLSELLKEIIFPADGSVLVSQKGRRNNTGVEGGCCGCCRANLRHEHFMLSTPPCTTSRYMPIPHTSLQNKAKAMSRARDTGELCFDNGNA